MCHQRSQCIRTGNTDLIREVPYRKDLATTAARASTCADCRQECCKSVSLLVSTAGFFVKGMPWLEFRNSL
jgi:hypothetical protein